MDRNTRSSTLSYYSSIAFVVAAFIEELAKYLGFTMLSDHPDFWTRSELETAVYVKSVRMRKKQLSASETDDEPDDDETRKETST
jgi:hypothetical protein